MLQARVTAVRCDLRQCNLDWFFRYQIFPMSLLRFYGQWQAEDREMAPGDAVAQEAHVPPGPLGLKLLFGVRVLSVYRSVNAAGFRYGTICGHPEIGTNEFSFSSDNDGVVVMIRTRARFGLAITRLFAFAIRPYVAFANRVALRRMTEQFLQRNARME